MKDPSSQFSSGINLVGLGPGNPAHLTLEAWRILTEADEVWFRTLHHPTITDLPDSLEKNSFDDLYDASESFESVYEQIVTRVISLGQREQGVIYAVPGHPLIAENTGPEILARAADKGIPVRVVEGLSFIEPMVSAVGLDPFPHASWVDAFELATAHHPAFPPDVPAFIAQIHSRTMATAVKLTLMAQYPDEHPVMLIHGAGTPEQQVEALPLYAIDHSEHIGLLTSLYLPPLEALTSFGSFLEIIAHLRAPEGCPWDRKQTHQTLRRYLIEETYEVLDALDAGDADELREEMGDLLLQIGLHAQIASENGDFNMSDVIHSINTKMIHRHPHVFGDAQADTPEAVVTNWEALKAKEKDAKGKNQQSVFDDIPRAMPALAQASKYQKKAAKTGYEWPEIDGVYDKLAEELAEVQAANTLDEKRSEIGDLLFVVVHLANWLKVDPEVALREANRRFARRFNHIEISAAAQGRQISEMKLDEMISLWQQAKQLEGSES